MNPRPTLHGTPARPAAATDTPRPGERDDWRLSRSRRPLRNWRLSR